MFEALFALIAVGTLGFYITLAIASIIIIACVEKETYPVPSIVAILLGIIYWKVIVANLSTAAIVIGVFAVAGALWAWFQWFRRVRKIAAKYRDKYGVTLTPSQLDDLKDEVKVSDHKALITGWIAFWPWDAFWTFTGDFFNMIYEAMANAYQNVSDNAVGKFTVKAPELKEVITNTEPPTYRKSSSRGF